MTDDLIVSVDEEKCRYQTYAMHDKDDDKVCKEIYEVLGRWPSANPKNCSYGIDCLHKLLPRIVEAESKKSSGNG